jgi:hypothetical protein
LNFIDTTAQTFFLETGKIINRNWQSNCFGIMVISSIYRGVDNAHLCNKKKQKKSHGSQARASIWAAWALI